MKPRTIASRPEISITASKARSRIVIGIGWSGPHQGSDLRIGNVGAALREGQMAPPARPESWPSRAVRALYSGGGGQRHAALAILATETRRCGIFFSRALPVCSGRAARGDIGDQAGPSA